MLKYLRYLVLLLIGLSLLTVALANRATVTLQALPQDLATLWGQQWQIDLPLFVVIFGGVGIGLLIGFVWEWLREHRHRVVASDKSAEVRRLERELAVMRDAKGVVKDDVIALLEKKA